jgi:hypothetical protein
MITICPGRKAGASIFLTQASKFVAVVPPATASGPIPLIFIPASRNVFGPGLRDSEQYARASQR